MLHHLYQQIMINLSHDNRYQIIAQIALLGYLLTIFFCFQITRKRSNGLIQAKAQIERKISVSSIMSDDSFSMEHLEEAGQVNNFEKFRNFLICEKNIHILKLYFFFLIF